MSPSKTPERNDKLETSDDCALCTWIERLDSRLLTGCSIESCKFSLCLSCRRRTARESTDTTLLNLKVSFFPYHPEEFCSKADPTYLPGRSATVYFRPKPTVPPSSPTPAPTSALDTLASGLKSVLPGTGSRDIVLGSLGILHPTVLANFELSRPCSALEIDVEPLL